jgi:antitoxin (DNA-binding transcriptional repressor) of toxin-antitoxin stability system
MVATMKPKSTVPKCLAVLDEVERRRRTVVVTKRGRRVARIIPLPEMKGSTLRGSLVYEGDPFAPVDVSWETNAGSS